MTLEAVLTWLFDHAEVIGRLPAGLVLAVVLAVLLGLALWWIWHRDRQDRRAVERRLSLIEEENRDCHSALSEAMSAIAELLVMLKHVAGGRRHQEDLIPIEHKVATLREQLCKNKNKYDGWARDGARARERQ